MKSQINPTKKKWTNKKEHKAQKLERKLPSFSFIFLFLAFFQKNTNLLRKKNKQTHLFFFFFFFFYFLSRNINLLWLDWNFCPKIWLSLIISHIFSLISKRTLNLNSNSSEIHTFCFFINLPWKKKWNEHLKKNSFSFTKKKKKPNFI